MDRFTVLLAVECRVNLLMAEAGTICMRIAVEAIRALMARASLRRRRRPTPVPLRQRRSRGQKPSNRWEFVDPAGSFGRRFVYALVALGAILFGVVLILLVTGTGLDDLNPPNKVLELTDQDVDPETTLVEKNLLKQNQIDARLAEAIWMDARDQLAGPALQEAKQALARIQICPQLEPVVRRWAQDFESGKAAAYTIWVADDDQQHGNLVDLRLNGVPLGQYAIEGKRYAITLVQRSGVTLNMQITGIVGARGGAVLRAETATSAAGTKHLREGKTDFWQVVVR
jgi:hypothetical protein